MHCHNPAGDLGARFGCVECRPKWISDLIGTVMTLDRESA